MLERYVLEVTPKKKGAIQEAFKIRRLMRLKIADYSLAIITPTKIAKFRIEFEYIISKFLTYFSLATFEIGLFYSLTIILFKVIFVNKKLQK